MNDSIIDTLASFFSDKFNAKLKRTETLQALIEQLCKKEKKLEKKLTKDLPDSERELYQSQLSVLKVQIEKAQNMLEK